jgi:hypothetical protein
MKQDILILNWDKWQYTHDIQFGKVISEEMVRVYGESYTGEVLVKWDKGNNSDIAVFYFINGKTHSQGIFLRLLFKYGLISEEELVMECL